MLDFDLFTRVLDEAGPTLGRVDFFNYGEAFLHKRAVEMCEYIKTKFPHIYLYTSTNGLALNEEKARRLVHSGIDEVTFSIDGASQDTYVRYRQRGKFDLATANLRAMADEKATERPRRAAAQLALHPLQLERLRRGDGEGAPAGHRVRRRPPHLGDHRSPRGLVLAPLRARDRPTSNASSTRSGITRASATPSPGRRRAPRLRCRRSPPTRRCRAGPARRSPCTRTCATSPAARSASWPATAGGWCASARSWSAPTARSSIATTPAPGCPATSRPAAPPTCRSTCRCRPSPAATRSSSTWSARESTGSRSAGSPTTTRSVWVR